MDDDFDNLDPTFLFSMVVLVLGTILLHRWLSRSEQFEQPTEGRQIEFILLIARKEDFEGDGIAKKIHIEAGLMKVDTLVAIIDSYREGYWDLRYHYLAIAKNNWCCGAMTTTASDMFDKLVQKYAEEGQADTIISAIRILQGSFLCSYAWDARGSGWAHTVTDEQRDTFKFRLEQAKNSLLKAASLDEADPTPYAALQTVALGLSGRQAGHEWLKKALERDSTNFQALAKHQYLLTQKWYGNTQYEALDFSRFYAMEKLPSNHVSRTILINALLDESRNAAWSFSDRMKLVKKPWVKKCTLSILRQVYLDNGSPPNRTLFYLEQQKKMSSWLSLMATVGALEGSIVEEFSRFCDTDPQESTGPELV